MDFLVQLIDYLGIEEYVLLPDKLQGRIIEKTPGFCGAEACICYTRIPVWTVISLQQQGADYQ